MKILILTLLPFSLYAGARFSCHKKVTEEEKPATQTVLVVRPGEKFAQEIVLSTEQAKKMFHDMHAKKKPFIIHKTRTTDVEVDI